MLPWSIAAWLLVAALSLLALAARRLDVATSHQRGLHEGLKQCEDILKTRTNHQGRW